MGHKNGVAHKTTPSITIKPIIPYLFVRFDFCSNSKLTLFHSKM